MYQIQTISKKRETTITHRAKKQKKQKIEQYKPNKNICVVMQL